MQNEHSTKIKHFTDLVAWQQAHQLVLRVYQVTGAYPDDEKFGLTSQSRRAAVSITSNIAEGFGRVTAKDKIHFYWIAKSSLAELESQFYIARDLVYVKDAIMAEILTLVTHVDRLLAGLIGSAQTFRS